MGLKTPNQAYGILASSISDSDTVIALSSGHGDRFGTLGGADYCYATLISNANELEVVKVTSRTGDSLTVVRGQDGSAAMAFSAGERIEARPCAAVITDILALIDQTAGIRTTGTRMPFQQTSAPVGWTKESNATYNDAALKIVTGSVGTGGADAFSTVFGTSKTTGSTTLTINQIPAHDHPVTDPGHDHAITVANGGNQVFGGTPATLAPTGSSNTSTDTTGITVGNRGGGQGHTHPLTANIKFASFIIATKD